jgi:hypothetical protein
LCDRFPGIDHLGESDNALHSDASLDTKNTQIWYATLMINNLSTSIYGQCRQIDAGRLVEGPAGVQPL